MGSDVPGSRLFLAFAALAMAPGAKGAPAGTDGAEKGRPTSWATPVSVKGLPNFHRVSDRLFRGAQPSAIGFRQLKEMGVRTVVNLRSFHSDRRLIGDTGLAYEHIYMKAWHPEDEELVRFLQIVAEPQRTPVFVHCQHGADRTGLMCAVYRMVVDGWSCEKAAREMVDGGFGFHGVWANLTRYLRGLDLDAICARAGVTRASPKD